MSRYYEPGRDPESRLRRLEGEMAVVLSRLNALLVRFVDEPGAELGGHDPPTEAPPRGPDGDQQMP